MVAKAVSVVEGQACGVRKTRQAHKTLRWQASKGAELQPQTLGNESACDQIKTHLSGRSPILRSKTPVLAQKEIEGLMLARYAIRNFLHDPAQPADERPDRLSFTLVVRVLRRRIRNPGAFPAARRQRMLERAVKAEMLEEQAVPSLGQSRSRYVKRKMTKFKVRHREPLLREIHASECRLYSEVHGEHIR